MRRAWWFRPLAASFAVWFTAYAVEPASLHACDLHDASPTVSATTHAHDGHHTPASGAEQTDEGASCCTCPGDCSPVSPAALSVGSAAWVIATAVATDTGLPDYEYLPVAAAHVLPFANGPPIRA
jgi:hypothetical protein